MDSTQGRRQLVSFTAWISGAFLASGAVRIIAAGIVGRALQPLAFGRMQYASSLFFYFFAVAEFGLPTLGTRRIARQPEEARGHAVRIGQARLVTASLGLVLLGLLAWPLAGEDWPLVALFGLGLLAQPFTVDWALRALGQIRTVALAEVLRGTLFLLAVSFLIRGPEHLGRTIALQVAAIWAAALALSLALRRRKGGVSASHPSPSTWATLREASPIAAGDIVASLFGQCDVLVLQWVAQSEAVGFYAPGLRLIQPFIALAAMAAQGALPVLAASFVASRARFARLLAEILEAVAWLVLPAMAIGWSLGPQILELVFGPSYAPGSMSFQLLILALGLLAWRSPLSMAFIAAGREWSYLKIILGSTALKFAAALALVPRWGPAGAATGAILGEVGFAAGSILFLEAAPAGELLRACWRPLVGFATGAAAFWLAIPLGGGAAWVLAASGYLLVFTSLRGKRLGELIQEFRRPQPRD